MTAETPFGIQVAALTTVLLLTLAGLARCNRSAPRQASDDSSMTAFDTLLVTVLIVALLLLGALAAAFLFASPS